MIHVQRFFLVLFFLLAADAVRGALPKPSVDQLAAAPEVYDNRSLCVEGAVEDLKIKRSGRGKPYVTLSIRGERSAVKVFMFGRPGFSEGQRVLACGRFQRERRVKEWVFRDELTASSVDPSPGLFPSSEDQGWTSVFSGSVTAVQDGDTLDVFALGRARRVRLDGVDCPEKRQAFGMKAKLFTSGQVFGRTVSVEVTDIDRYGRFIGKVRMTDGGLLNAEIVRAGLGWWYRRYSPDDRELEALESEARENRRGLRQDPSPQPPWLFRHPSRPKN